MNRKRHLHLFLAASIYIVSGFPITCFTINGFVGSRSYENGLKSKRTRTTTIHQETTVVLKRSERLHASYDDNSDEELFITLLVDKLNENHDNISDTSNETSKYAHLANITSPSPSVNPDEIISLIMNVLRNNDVPEKDAGLKLVWEFATDTTQYVFRNNRTEFIESCHETAEEFATSFYGAAMNGQSWNIETPLNRVGGETGWIATQVMKTISSDGRMRRWQWEFRKNRRPPCLNCWKVESIGSSDRNGDFEARDRGDGWSD